ncbi:MAG: sodium:proton antiporter [bacterium]|nr:sodium:proton antiporter [bacterium]
MGADNPALILVLALAAGVLAQSMARHLRLPGIMLLLVFGVGLGPDGFDWIRPRALGEEGLFAIVDLAVAVILFEGGLNLERSRLLRAQTAIRRLISSGAIITLIGGAWAAFAWLDWDWRLALLYGSLVVVTGPTVIGPLVAELRLRPKVSTVLEAEGVLIDPIGAILAVLMLRIVLEPDADALAESALHLATGIGFGASMGIVSGLILGMLLRLPSLIPEGFGNVFALVFVLLLFQGCEAYVEDSGILAVTLAGVAVGNLGTRVDRDLREFKDQLTVLLIGLLFVLLAADVRAADVQGLGWRGIAVVATLVLAVRPLNVWLSTMNSSLNWRERILIGWIAPRGIVAAAIASLVAAALETHNYPGGVELRALVFLTITGTVVLAGVTALPVAALLGQRLPGRQTVAILGAHGLGLALAKEIRKGGVPVVMLDSNPTNARKAQEMDLPVVFGNALQDRTMQRARFESVGTAIGATPNEALNGLFVDRARNSFHVPNGYVALVNTESGVTKEILEGQQSHLLFDDLQDIERWDVRSRHDEMAIEYRVWEPPAEAEESDGGVEPAKSATGEDYVILTIQRGDKIRPMHSGFKIQARDVAAVAIHCPEFEEVDLLLRKLGWMPKEPETSQSPETPES